MSQHGRIRRLRWSFRGSPPGYPPVVAHLLLSARRRWRPPGYPPCGGGAPPGYPPGGGVAPPGYPPGGGAPPATLRRWRRLSSRRGWPTVYESSRLRRASGLRPPGAGPGYPHSGRFSERRPPRRIQRAAVGWARLRRLGLLSLIGVGVRLLCERAAESGSLRSSRRRHRSRHLLRLALRLPMAGATRRAVPSTALARRQPLAAGRSCKKTTQARRPRPAAWR